jgi:general secretion pathway protein H
MASPAAKAKMRISVAGSKARHRSFPPVQQRGFTLLELLVVVSIIAIASVGVAFAMRDSAQTQVEREAQRLAALLESARAQSRTLGVAVTWRNTGTGFRFEGLAQNALPANWLDPDTTATPALLELGPDPLIAPQSVTLGNARLPGALWRVETDGLRPFAVHPVNDAAPSGGLP